MEESGHILNDSLAAFHFVISCIRIEILSKLMKYENEQAGLQRLPVPGRRTGIATRATATPRKDGLFGFNPGCDFKTIAIRDNIIECRGQARPLLRCAESYSAMIHNNRLLNVSDTDRFENPQSGAMENTS